MYQVWTHNEYEGWDMTECEDLAGATVAIMGALKQGKEPILTQVIPFEMGIKYKEDKKGEAIKSKAKVDKDPGTKSKSPVRPGDTAPVPEQH